MKSIKIVSLLTLVTIYFVCFIEIPVGIRINRSKSLPHTLFLSRSLKFPKRNQYVSLSHPISQKRLAKQIIGMPGDRIKLKNNQFFINDHFCGSICHTTSKGESLSPIETREIPEEYVFVYAPHSESFDSRYQQFGLIHINQLKEVLWPIF